MNRKLLNDILGWYGALAVLGAYFLVSQELLSAHTPLYLLLNASGSLGLLIESYAKRDYQPAFLNLAWLGIALIGLFQLLPAL